MTGHNNRAVVERTLAGFFGGDYETAAQAMADDAVVEWPQSGERIVGRDACLIVYRNYPGGSPTYRLQRISGEGDHFVAEAIADYGGEKTHAISIIELRDGKIVKQTDYWANPFEAPAWRAQWVERMEQV